MKQKSRTKRSCWEESRNEKVAILAMWLLKETYTFMEVQKLYNIKVLKIVHFKISFKENRFEYMWDNLLVTHRILYRSKEQHNWGKWGRKHDQYERHKRKHILVMKMLYNGLILLAV